MAKYIGTVFAVGGDMTYPPDSATDGSVNLNAGYTPQYEIDLASGDPTAKAVERNVMNGLFNWLFDNQAFDQAHGVAPWFSNYSGGYPINALVADNSTGTWQIYRSLKSGNSDIPTMATSWESIITQTEMLNRIPFALGGAKGSSSGAIATGTNLNSWLYSQGTWVVTTDAIAANITNLPSARQGVLIARNTTTAYNPSNNADGGSFLQMYFDADGKVYVRFYAVPSSGTTQTWTAWRTIAFLDSPAFTGVPTAPTAAAGTNTTQIATTAFVSASFAPLASPALTGNPTAPTPAQGDADTSIATTAFVDSYFAKVNGNVNNQFSVKDATVSGQAVNLGQLNTQIATRALVGGNVNQKFLVQGVTNDTNAAAAMWQLTAGLASKANLGGSASQGFAVAGGTDANSAVAYNQFQGGTNSNGAWVKLPSGSQWCRQNLNLPANASTTWTFPLGFVAAPAVFITNFNSGDTVWLNGIGPNNCGIYNNGTSKNVNVLAIW